MSQLQATPAPSARFLFGFDIEGRRDSMYGLGPNRETAEQTVLARLQKRFPLAELPETLDCLQEIPC